MEDYAFIVFPSQCIDSGRMLRFSRAETRQEIDEGKKIAEPLKALLVVGSGSFVGGAARYLISLAI